MGSRKKLIWAGTFNQALRYAEENSLRRNEWVYVTRPLDVLGHRDFDIVNLPGWMYDTGKREAMREARHRVS